MTANIVVLSIPIFSQLTYEDSLQICFAQDHISIDRTLSDKSWSFIDKSDTLVYFKQVNAPNLRASINRPKPQWCTQYPQVADIILVAGRRIDGTGQQFDSDEERRFW